MLRNPSKDLIAELVLILGKEIIRAADYHKTPYVLDALCTPLEYQSPNDIRAMP